VFRGVLGLRLRLGEVVLVANVEATWSRV
jgi:hypothetical protein